jgi:HK97 family phage portal protein
MGVREWLGLSVREDEPGPSDPSTALSIPSRSAATRTVSAADAFSLSMVYRAVQIHVISCKQLSIDTKRDGKIITSEALIRRPDIDASRSAFLEQTVVSLACSGNAYWRKFFNDRGEVSNLKVLNPLDVRIEFTRAGNVTKYHYQGVELLPNEVKHLKLLRVPGTVYGLGPIQAAQSELRGALDLRDYSANWFEESGVPNGVLKTDQVLAPDQAEEAKTRWNTSQGARQGVAVLGNGLSYSPVYLNPRDAQFLESQQFNVTQIARLFGVPSSLMLATVEGSTDTYQNVSQDWLGYVRFSLMAYLIEIEDALSDLLPRGQEAKFNVEALLRSDTATRYAAHKVALDAGFMTVNEVRDIENLAPLDASAIKQPTPVKEFA